MTAVAPLQLSEFLATHPLLRRTMRLVAGFVVVYALGRLLVAPTIVRTVRARNEENRTIIGAVELYTHVAVVLAALVAALAVGGYGELLTRSTIAVAIFSLTVGVAGREVLGTVVGGLFLVADENFNVGDYVAWGDTEGIVESIGFRVTHVRTVDNEVISVPNTALTTNVITKPYGRARFRVNREFGVDYGHLEAALDIFESEAVADPAVLADPEPKIRVASFDDDAVRVQVLFWVADPSHGTVLDTFSSYARRVWTRCAEAGVSLGATSSLEMGGNLAVRRDDVEVADERGE